jgi:GT2 family glycosyltransferase
MTGFVVIGRNEGERLKACLRSVSRDCTPVVYVDSGSSDGSISLAKTNGAEIISLDATTGFSMARARNAGWRKLIERWPEMNLIHFVDGDCEIVEGWVSKAEQFLNENPAFAVVCGRRRERFREKSVFNRLCDIEWNTAIGEVNACGGDALLRRSALEQIGGYEETLIAGEEPEMCLRMRLAGWKIQRLDADMSIHDANILHWSQWWRRCFRAGYGAAYVVIRKSLNNGKGELPFQHLVESAIQWMTIWIVGFGIAVFWVLVGWKITGYLIAGILVSLTLFQSLRIARSSLKRAGGWLQAIEYGLFTMLAKVPQFIGIRKFQHDRTANKLPQIIEYKS